MRTTFIDTPAALTAMLSSLPDCKGQPPALYIDLEGNNLGRLGTLSLIIILVHPQNVVHLVDVTTLKGKTFTTQSSDGTTLNSILEDPDKPKVFFDIRNDSSALSGLYGIRVQGIEDLQLFEFASRNGQKRTVNGLARCIEFDLGLGVAEKQRWQKVKNDGVKLFDPQKGGSYAVFDQRPLSAAVKQYCVQDIVHMPALRSIYLNKLCDAWWLKIAEETKARIRYSQSPTFTKGKYNAMGPAGWAWQPAAHEKNKRTLFKAGTPPPSAVAQASARYVDPEEAWDAFMDDLDDHFMRQREEEEDEAWGYDDDDRWEPDPQENWDGYISA